jgi:hypothetical protein
VGVEDVAERGQDRGQARAVQRGLRVGGRVAGQQQQFVAVAQRQVQRLGQPDELPVTLYL